MSGKKKVIQICDECNSTLLVKDYQRHTAEFCKKPPEESEVSVVKHGVIVKGLLTSVDKVQEYLPPDSFGWICSNSVLLHPQTIEMFGYSPRQPVTVQLSEAQSMIGIIWPCKELGLLKIALTMKDPPKERMVTITPIVEYTLVKHLAVSVSELSDIEGPPLVEYLQMFMSNTFVRPCESIPLSYYGRSLIITPIEPLDKALKKLNISNEKPSADEVYYVSTNCAISIYDQTSSQSGTSSENAEAALAAIGGMHAVKEALVDYVIKPFMSDGSCCSLLMWGLPGSGKSLLLRTLERVLIGSVQYFESPDEFVERNAFISRDSIVILDWQSAEKEHKSYQVLCGLLSQQKVRAVILSIRSADDLDLGIRVRFPVEVEVDVPSEAERLEILISLTKRNVETAPELLEIARRTHGFTGGDLHSVVSSARFSKAATEAERLEAARRRVRPTGIRQFILEVPDVKWDDIGGNEELKLEIQQAVIWPQQHPEAFARFGIDPPQGILLYGPPGCSKTLVARALANESKMNFLAVKGPELFSKWVGDSEKAIRELFARARQVAPTIVFFDEIDAVGASRGSEKSSGVSDRVLAQLLTELDGLEKQAGVILLAATNRPDQLDSALLRPGRLDRSIHVGLPTPTTRRAILTMRTAKMAMADDVDLDTLVFRTQGYSGAELVAVCRTAALCAMREDINAMRVTWAHFEESLKAIVPRTEKYLLDIYEQFKEGCMSN